MSMCVPPHVQRQANDNVALHDRRLATSPLTYIEPHLLLIERLTPRLPLQTFGATHAVVPEDDLHRPCVTFVTVECGSGLLLSIRRWSFSLLLISRIPQIKSMIQRSYSSPLTRQHPHIIPGQVTTQHGRTLAPTHRCALDGPAQSLQSIAERAAVFAGPVCHPTSRRLFGRLYDGHDSLDTCPCVDVGWRAICVRCSSFNESADTVESWIAHYAPARALHQVRPLTPLDASTRNWGGMYERRTVMPDGRIELNLGARDGKHDNHSHLETASGRR